MTAIASQSEVSAEVRTFDMFGRRGRDVILLTHRNLVHIAREPLRLADVTVQPVLFTLLFVYIFGSGIPVPGGGSYKGYAIAGLITLNLTTSAVRTALGLSVDLNTGVIDRFRTLPMWVPAVLVARSLSDLLAATLSISTVILAGLAIGWRAPTGIASVIAGCGIVLLFSFALSWASAAIGLVSKGPESAQSLGLVILFPLGLVSNAMVPTQGMSGWLRAVTDWNPVSAVTSACRALFGNPNPSGTAWPMQHPIFASVLWSAAILAVCGPLAARLYRRRTID